jgi:hypothetical protein
MWNKVERIWTMSPFTYPYVGRSAILRGDDTGETGAPPPTGVKDLQLYPPDGDALVVAAFVAPVAGTYYIDDLAARRVAATGRTSTVTVRAPASQTLATLKPSNDMAWVKDTGRVMAGRLEVGDRIYIAVGRDGDSEGDATEVAFSIVREP